MCLGAFDKPTKKSSFDLATESSLEAVAFGMMSDDLYGSFIASLHTGRSWATAGRERVASRACNNNKNKRLATGATWLLMVKLPIVIFNSTDAATGRRILFDTVPTPRTRFRSRQNKSPFQLSRITVQRCRCQPSDCGKNVRDISIRFTIYTSGEMQASRVKQSPSAMVDMWTMRGS